MYQNRICSSGGMLRNTSTYTVASLLIIQLGDKRATPQLIASRLGQDLAHPSVDLIYQKLYKEFIEALDANDNGISAYPADVKPAFNTGGVTLASQVGSLNPSWNTPVDQAGEDALFLKASTLMGETFERKLDFYVSGWLPARDFVVEALAARTQHDADGRILVFQQSIPWKDHLFTLEAEMNITEVGKQPLFVLYGDKAGRRQLGGKGGREGLGEGALVVVKVLHAVVLALHVDNDVALLEGDGVARAEEGRVGVVGEETEHVDSQGLIGVEVATAGLSAWTRWGHGHGNGAYL